MSAPLSTLSVLAFTLLLPFAAADTPATSAPAGVARVAAVTPHEVVFEGAVPHGDAWLPDGRVWRFDRVAGSFSPLTRPADFGAHFFASAGPVTHDERLIVRVTGDGGGARLYLVGLRSGAASPLADASELQLADIVDGSLTLSPDGRRLAFSGYDEIYGTGSSDGFVWAMGVYSLALDGPTDFRREWAGNPVDLVYPHYRRDGTLEVRRRSEPAPRPLEADLPAVLRAIAAAR